MPSTNQNYLFDFLANVFVPKEILIYKTSTMMEITRTDKYQGKVNSKFQLFADDFDFKIKPS